jgi:phage replication initiation protein
MASIKRLPPYVPTISEVLKNEAAARLTAAECQAIEQAVRESVAAQGAAACGRAGAASGGAAGYIPLSNRGGNSVQRPEWAAVAQSLHETEILLTDSGELKTVLVRSPAPGECAFIDCLRFVVHEDSFRRDCRPVPLTDEEMIRQASAVLTSIFGFGVTDHEGKKRDFYADSWALGDGAGYVAMGGSNQHQTVLFVIHGTGCMAAADGWERRLFQWLSAKAVRPTITRVDLAHDCFAGDYWNVDMADRLHDEGGFTIRRTPKHGYVGDWKNPDGSGRTITIGSRKNGKFFRAYEKGREQGDRESDWNRAEVEFHNTDRIIPLDVLINPSQYFVGAYPCLQIIAHHIQPSRMATKTKAAQISVDKALENIKNGYGKYLRFLAEVLGPDVLLARVQSDTLECPARLKVPDYRFGPAPIHLAPSACLADEFGLVVGD